MTSKISEERKYKERDESRMSRSWKKAGLVGLSLGLLFVVAVCSTNIAALFGKVSASDSGAYDSAKIIIHGLQAQEFAVTVGDLKKLPAVTKHAEATQSNGLRIKVDATGPLLDTFLRQYGKTQADFSRIRITAKDDYSVAVPAEVLKNRQIILSYINDGEPLQAKFQPLRIVIPEERAMYWVNDTDRIDFETGEVSKPAAKVVLLETAVKNLPQEDYQYFDSLDKAVKTKDLIAKFGDLSDPTVSNVYLKAGDGLEQNDTKAIFLNAYLKISGQDAPEFLAPQYPQGMHIKELLLFNYGRTAFFDCAQGQKILPAQVSDKRQGIAFSDLVKQVGLLNADHYKLSGADGSSLELALDQLSSALVSTNEQGTVSFTTGTPANQTISGLISIEPLSP